MIKSLFRAAFSSLIYRLKNNSGALSIAPRHSEYLAEKPKINYLSNDNY